MFILSTVLITLSVAVKKNFNNNPGLQNHERLHKIKKFVEDHKNIVINQQLLPVKKLRAIISLMIQIILFTQDIRCKGKCI